MAATYSEIGAGVNNSASATYTLTLTGSANVGDLVIVFAQNSNADAQASGAITDSQLNTWTLVNGNNIVENASAVRGGIWFSVLTTALIGGTDTIKLTTSSVTNAWKTLKVTKLAGATTISFDKNATSNNQAATVSPVTGTTVATTQATEFAVCMFLYADAGGVPSFTAPAGWSQTATTQQTNGSGTTGATVSTAYKFLAATGTQSATATLGVAQTAGGEIATFKYTDAVAAAFIPKILGEYTI